MKNRSFQQSCDQSAEHRMLAVVLHGWMGDADKMGQVVRAVKEAYADVPALDVFVPDLPYRKFFCFVSAAEIVARLLTDIDDIVGSGDRYSRIVLVAYSLGAVIARRVYVAATGIDSTIPSEVPLCKVSRRHWANMVERIVALGGANRGWVNSGRLGWIEGFLINLVALLGHGSPRSRKPTMFDARRGAPFIVQTRLQWMALRRRPRPSSEPTPLVIQLLGTQDNIVAPDDIVDFASNDASDPDYFYVELPQTTHSAPIVLEGTPNTPAAAIAAVRRQRLIDVLRANSAQLASIAIPRDFLADTVPPPPDPTMTHTHIVFVIHGIRDDGYWTRKIAQRIQEHTRKEKPTEAIVRSVTDSYGYFAMLPFVLPWIRRQKVEWLMDLYVGLMSQYPGASFSYVGHSNGTYLAARALEDYPAVSFRHVFFAGSVVRTNYDWVTLVEKRRVSKIVNMVATADWVVAIFPRGLEPFRRFFDLGGAGFIGFDQGGQSNVFNVEYVKGAHGAGLVETQWNRIAAFIVDGIVPSKPDPDYADVQSKIWKAIAGVSTTLLLAILGLAGTILLLILMPIFGPYADVWTGTASVFCAMAYLTAMRFFVTRL